ncbi:zf-HC2 domain-containing protein [Marinobacter sp. TBZ242]|uniref:Zf-HC2 domain-containing protein n=1 Tax=Marinobacter azerbaijanicus TaxID=3050455 RepID=A0ABT7IAS7_9GAMM|nr:zf-HC2 domain-containing protein [Marinobacter sp. TBZ242]MDL0430770.1 zf-HC2 domain-containing protein [Marinobacter sp. TBZ242]
MTCRQFHQRVDSLVRGELPPDEQDALQAHASRCPDCSELWEDERRLQKGIMAQTIPAPNDDFESRIRAMALSGNAPRKSGLPQAPLWASAVAAVLALGIFIGMQIGPSDPELPGNDLAETPAAEMTDPAPQTRSAPEVKTVRLAFNSRRAMENVTLTLELPPNAELVPFPGRQTISWTVDLKEGDNVLALPINVLFPGSGELVAHLDDGTRRKTFSTAIQGNTEPSS